MENNKKDYITPEVQMIEFNFKENVLASGAACETTVVRTFEGCDRIWCTPRYTA